MNIFFVNSKSAATSICSQDAGKFAILNSNGLAWEVTGVLQKKINEQAPLPKPKPKAPVAPDDKQDPKTDALPPPTNGCVVSIEARVEKLPLGQSLVTLVRESDCNMQPVIQIKVSR